MNLAFVPVPDDLKAYPSMINDFDDEDCSLVDYFERVWVVYNANLGSRHSEPKFSLQLWKIYERGIQDLPRSNNAVDG
ncbi:unnamed protein product [Rotaria sp. Silwood2]|nr:unnamed protein product [Rotaria sp. Silwood2]